MICNKCGAEIPNDASFCNYCGEPVYVEDNSNSTEQSSSQAGNQNYNNQNQNQYNGQYGNPYQPPYQQQQQYPPNAKSAYLAGLLAILVGTLGIHNFYLGNTGKAVAQLLISILTCGIGAIAVEIWALIEGIMLFTGSINVDANGVPLKQSF